MIRWCLKWVRVVVAVALVPPLAAGATAALAAGDADPPASAMAVSAHPLASRAGAAVLRQGGHAVDAAVAVQMVLSVVEPQESGIGGGGFLLLRDAAADDLLFYDGRETAPAAAGPERFLIAGRWPMPHFSAVVSGRSVGTPGLVAMLELAHEHHGRLPWHELLQPAIRLAQAGVDMPGRLRRQVSGDPSLRLFSDLRRHFVTAAAADEPRLHNHALAATLREVSQDGARAFYHGKAAENLVQAVRGRAWLPGDLSAEDLASYTPRLRAPVCGRYRQWRVCGAPPPSSGGIATIQILGMLEPFDLTALGVQSAEVVHLVAEASRLAFADRQRYLGDPEFVDVPVAGLLDPAYLAERSRLIDGQRARQQAGPGAPGIAPLVDTVPLRLDHEQGTSHFSVVDAQGNAVAFTSSIEAPFGARFSANGYLVNNQLTDFDFQPRRNGAVAANAVAPGKRPRSSMSPTFVFDGQGQLQLVLGSRGGSRIIGYVVKTLIAVLDGGLTLQQAIDQPNYLHRGGALELEEATAVAELAGALRAAGHRVEVHRLESGVHGLQRQAEGWRGAADGRMEGAAAGH